MNVDPISAVGQVSPLSPVSNANSASTAVPAPSLPFLPDQSKVADTQTSKDTPAASKPVDAETLKKSVEAINAFIQPHAGSIEFSIDQSSGKILLKIVDTKTDTVLMQIPSKAALALSQDIGNLKGFLIKDSA